MSIYTKTPIKKPNSNTFNMSHPLKFTAQGGKLYPILCQEILPGDLIKYRNSTLGRMAPMIHPIYDDIDIGQSGFFVPNRILWQHWEKFITAGVPGITTPAAPYFDNVENVQPGDLAQFLGVPIASPFRDDGVPFVQVDGYYPRISALPFAAYKKIFIDWFQDENLGVLDPESFMLTDGANVFDNFNTMLTSAWMHDRFTSALPFAQKGDPVTVPIGNVDVDVPVYYDEDNPESKGSWVVKGFPPPAGSSNVVVAGTGGDETVPTKIALHDAAYNPLNTLYARTSDISDLGTITVNALRWAEALQTFLERNAFAGTRLIEFIKAQYGVISSDKRLQRSECIFDSVSPMVISEVLQTSQSGSPDTPLGTLGGHGLSFGRNGRRAYFAEEHGFFIVLQRVRPKTTYGQGLNKMFRRFSPLDYGLPLLAHLGMQEIKNYEIYLQGIDKNAENEATFGYEGRYNEYRTMPGRICGDFVTDMNTFTMARIFPELPNLNNDFISCNPTQRIFSFTGAGNPYWFVVHHKYKMARRLPLFALPSLTAS